MQFMSGWNWIAPLDCLRRASRLSHAVPAPTDCEVPVRTHAGRTRREGRCACAGKCSRFACSRGERARSWLKLQTHLTFLSSVFKSACFCICFVEFYGHLIEATCISTCFCLFCRIPWSFNWSDIFLGKVRWVCNSSSSGGLRQDPKAFCLLSLRKNMIMHFKKHDSVFTV